MRKTRRNSVPFLAVKFHAATVDVSSMLPLEVAVDKLLTHFYAKTYFGGTLFVLAISESFNCTAASHSNAILKLCDAFNGTGSHPSSSCAYY